MSIKMKGFGFWEKVGIIKGSFAIFWRQSNHFSSLCLIMDHWIICSTYRTGSIGCSENSIIIWAINIFQSLKFLFGFLFKCGWSKAKLWTLCKYSCYVGTNKMSLAKRSTMNSKSLFRLDSASRSPPSHWRTLGKYISKAHWTKWCLWSQLSRNLDWFWCVAGRPMELSL